jgi:putative glutamine amidotransferase
MLWGICMNNKPIIGVIGRAELSEDNRKLIMIHEEIRRSIIRNGGIPMVILPTQDVDYYGTPGKEIGDLNVQNKKDILQQIMLCDGLLFQGGTRSFDYDTFIVNAGIELDVPMLGICLGMQVMAKATGGYSELIKDSKYEHKQIGVPYVHDVAITGSSRLVSIFNGQRIGVNSRHKYYVECPGKYNIVALSADGYVEAIEMNNGNFNVGVQWHPEDLVDSVPNNRLFSSFIDHATIFKNNKESDYEKRMILKNNI